MDITTPRRPISLFAKPKLILCGLAVLLPLSTLHSGETADAELLKRFRSGDGKVILHAFDSAKSQTEISDEVWKTALEVFYGGLRDKSREDAAVRLINSLALKAMAKKASPKTVAESLRPLLGDKETAWFAVEVAGVSPEVASALVPEVAKMMGDSNKSVRYFAAQALGTAGQAATSAAPRLAEALINDPSEDVRLFSAESLGKIGDTSPDTIRALISALLKDDTVSLYADEALIALQFDPKPYVDEWVKCADLLTPPDALLAKMPQLGTVAIGPIIKHAKTKPLNEIETEADALGALGKDATPALAPLLQSKDDHERFLAFTALAAIRNRDGENADWIKPYLEDEALPIRLRAIQGYSASSASTDQKLAMLSQKFASSTGAERHTVVSCIADYPKEAKPLLRQLIDSLGTAKGDEYFIGVAILAIEPHSQDGRAAVQKALNSPDTEIVGETLWELTFNPTVGKLFVPQLQDMLNRASVSDEQKERVRSVLADLERTKN